MNLVWFLHQTPSHGVKSIAHMNEYWCVITNQFTIAISVRAFFSPQNLSILHQSQFQLTWPLALALNIANISISSDKGKHICLLRPVSSNCFLLSLQLKGICLLMNSRTVAGLKNASYWRLECKLWSWILMRKTQFCLPQRIVLPPPSLLLSRCVSAEVTPRLTDADLWALQLSSSSASRALLFPP